MDKHQLFRWGLIIISLILFYLAYLVVAPFLITIIISFIMSFVFYPIHRQFLRLTRNRQRLSSTLSLLVVLIILVVPFAFLTTSLVSDSTQAYRSFLDYDFENAPFLDAIPSNLIAQPQDLLDGIVKGVKDYVVNSAPDVIGEVASFMVHLFIFFFILFFAFIHGPSWYGLVRSVAPLSGRVKNHLFGDLERVLNAMIYGQLVTSVIQGFAGGLMFFIFGIPNPVFWGFMMVIFSFVPFLGTPFIFVPAALIELIQGDYIAGFGVLIVGGLIIMNLDNFLRPYLVSKFAPIHPILVIVGVFGGLAAFGLAGFIIGPLILALLFTIFKDFASHKELLMK